MLFLTDMAAGNRSLPDISYTKEMLTFIGVDSPTANWMRSMIDVSRGPTISDASPPTKSLLVAPNLTGYRHKLSFSKSRRRWHCLPPIKTEGWQMGPHVFVPAIALEPCAHYCHRFEPYSCPYDLSHFKRALTSCLQTPSTGPLPIWSPAPVDSGSPCAFDGSSSSSVHRSPSRP